MRLISAGSLVRAQSGPHSSWDSLCQGCRRGSSGRRKLSRCKSKTHHFVVWRECHNSDQTPFPPHAEKCSLTSAYWVEIQLWRIRSEGSPSFLTDIKIIKLLRAYDGCLGANRR